MMVSNSRKYAATLIILGMHGTNAFSPQPTGISTIWNKKKSSLMNRLTLDKTTALKMTPETDDKSNKKRQINYNLKREVSLSAFTITADAFESEMARPLSIPRAPSFDMEGVMAVVSASLLITGNTVGAGTIILPEIASGPGMLPSLGLFTGIYLTNLISGLLIGDIAIKQFEENEDLSKAAPSSFKDLADNLLDFEGVNGGLLVSIASVLINYCVLAFALMRSGEVAMDLASMLHLADIPALSQTSLAAGFSVILTTLASTQSTKTLSQIASAAASLLFLSFGSLLMPGLANMDQDIFATLATPGTYLEDPSGSLTGSLSIAASIFISTTVYQNIVPTVTKLLGYDRSKVFSALTLGSLIPILMYLTWCFVVLGGGVSINNLDETGVESLLLLAFSAASIGGSSIACVMSTAEECKSQLANFSSKKEDPSKVLFKPPATKDEKGSGFSFPSVALAVVPPLAAGMVFSHGEGMTTALKLSGSYGSPLMYGVLPVLLAWKQKDVVTEVFNKQKDMVPGGMMSHLALAFCAIGFIGEELIHDIGSFF